MFEGLEGRPIPQRRPGRIIFRVRTLNCRRRPGRVFYHNTASLPGNAQFFHRANGGRCNMTQTATLEPIRHLIDVFTSCPLCGSPNYKLVFDHEVCGNVVRCTQCQLKYTRSRRTAPMAELRQKNPGPLPDVIVEKQDSQIDDFLDILKRIKGFQPNGKLLELGCLNRPFSRGGARRWLRSHWDRARYMGGRIRASRVRSDRPRGDHPANAFR